MHMLAFLLILLSLKGLKAKSNPALTWLPFKACNCFLLSLFIQAIGHCVCMFIVMVFLLYQQLPYLLLELWTLLQCWYQACLYIKMEAWLGPAVGWLDLCSRVESFDTHSSHKPVWVLRLHWMFYCSAGGVLECCALTQWFSTYGSWPFGVRMTFSQRPHISYPA